MYHLPSYRWRASYETDKGSPYDVPDTEISECPVSYMSAESVELVAALTMARQEREATGENPLPPVRQWPVRLLDVARLMHIEEIKEHNACMEKESEERDGQ